MRQFVCEMFSVANTIQTSVKSGCIGHCHWFFVFVSVINLWLDYLLCEKKLHLSRVPRAARQFHRIHFTNPFRYRISPPKLRPQRNARVCAICIEVSCSIRQLNRLRNMHTFAEGAGNPKRTRAAKQKGWRARSLWGRNKPQFLAIYGNTIYIYIYIGCNLIRHDLMRGSMERWTYEQFGEQVAYMQS